MGWVKGSFFKQRRFHDVEDLAMQLAQWLQEANTQRPSRVTGVIPPERMAEERKRLRRCASRPPSSPFAFLFRWVPPRRCSTTVAASDAPRGRRAAGHAVSLRKRVKIVAGRWQAEHAVHRQGSIARLPEHRAAHLAAVAGARASATSAPAALRVRRGHRCGADRDRAPKPSRMVSGIDQLHELLQSLGPRRSSGRVAPRCRPDASPWRSSPVPWSAPQRPARRRTGTTPGRIPPSPWIRLCRPRRSS